MTERDRRELDALLDELEETIDDVRRVVEGPPTRPGTRELFRLTDEYAIPTAIAFLEANVRALELLQGTIRTVERAAPAEGRSASEAGADLGGRSLARIERALGDAEDAVAEADLPRDREARRLLGEARRLNEEIRGRIEAAGRPDDDAVRIDVESELATIKESVEEADDETTGDEA